MAAALAALAAFALQPAASGRAALDDGQNPNCPAVTALPAVTGKVFELTGQLSCYRPGGSKPFGVDVAPGNTQQRLVNPRVGDPCRNTYTHNVRFSEDTGGNPQAIFASFGGVTAGSRPLTALDGAMMGTHDAYVTDVQLGSYELSNPSDPNSLICVLDPTYHYFCPGTGQLDELCYAWLLHPILGSPPRPQAWGPLFAAEIGRLQALAGTIGSAPTTMAVVNTGVCFWIEGMGIPRDRDMVLILPGGLDASGRQIFYTLHARLQFTGVSWNFDDPYGNDLAPLPSQCQGRPQVVAHQYRQISDERHPDGQYHVTATENYSITVTLHWIDSDGPQTRTVDSGVTDPTLAPDIHLQRVVQVEGVPIGSP